MMRGLLLKTWHEVWLMTLLFGLALLTVIALLTFVYPQFQEELIEIIDRLPFIRPMITSMLGSDVGDKLNAQNLQAILWVHPIVLTLLWAHAIVFCTRLPAGEIDRGTIDVLLGLPVSRRTVYYSEAIACRALPFPTTCAQNSPVPWWCLPISTAFTWPWVGSLCWSLR